ncbi:hypothetical protein COF61_25200 [Bacillus toyonensis]|uniref:hypothetical protein n=1 Tax=Bacillus toyonensis TaxID=155322 RepID=UPI000BFC06B7|nr:hypothetical protein [Bacillus toyonensis]PHD57195.1 hypothetical protein COF61_25200 [Bacillus toyonensis]
MNSGIFKSMILLSMFLATSSIEAEEIDNKNANVSVISIDYVQSASVNGWSTQGGKWSYYKDVVLQKNWQSIGGKWYYLERDLGGSEGIMKKDWQLVDGKW